MPSEGVQGFAKMFGVYIGESYSMRLEVIQSLRMRGKAEKYSSMYIQKD